MSNAEQNQKEFQTQEAINNASINHSSSQNISATENENKGGFFKSETSDNIINQNQPIDAKNNIVAVNINNTSQNQNTLNQKKNLDKGESTQKNPNETKEANFNSEMNISSSSISDISFSTDSHKVQKNCFITILTLISLAIGIALIVLLSYIYKWTKKDPLQNLNIKTEPSDTSNINTEKLNGKEHALYNHMKSNSDLRYLDDDCNDFESQLKDNNYKLDKVFKLKFNIVNKMALGILIIIIINFGLFLLMVMSSIGIICFGECCFSILAIITVFLFFVSIISDFVNVILFIIMLVNYFKGNTTGEFLDYYKDCMDNYNRPELKSDYDKLNKFNKSFIAFIVLNSVSMFINVISSFIKIKTVGN